MIRLPAVAGAFYPDDPKELKIMIEDFLARANPPKIVGRLRALIVPHAGYIYSGPVAAFGYKLLRDRSARTPVKIVLLGPAHTVGFAGAALSTATEWETPLGRVPLWRPAKVESPFFDFDLAHLPEHCLEVQLPFLQCVFQKQRDPSPRPFFETGGTQDDNYQIFPLVTGEVNPEEMSSALNKLITEQDLIIVSSDLSHYHPYRQAITLDKTTIEAILKKQLTILETQGDACGLLAILTLLHLAKNKSWSAQLLDYRNSGDTAGDKRQVVGYAAIAFGDLRLIKS